jgi:aldose 1-epimerase
MNTVKQSGSPTIEKRLFGTLPSGEGVDEYTLTNSKGMVVRVITYGGTITECRVPDRKGVLANVALGFDNLAQYLAKHPRFGALIGRFANRIANARFNLDGTEYKLAATKGSSTLHGGVIGFDKKIWSADGTLKNGSPSLRLHYISPDMEEGFPGTMTVTVTYLLDDDNTLHIKYEAETDKPSPINLTNHSYFNLSGAGRGNILNHVARFDAVEYTPVNADLIPTGEIASVDQTALDFRAARSIGSRIEEIGGYDHNYVLSRSDSAPVCLGSVSDPASGRVLTTYTDQPAFQFFTANGLDGSIKGPNGNYEQYAGFCLETQHFPDSVNQPKFPNVILRPGEKFESVTSYRFSVED